VVDLACGRGRITVPLAAAGIPVVGLDRNASFLAELGRRAARDALPIQRIRADLEASGSPPLRDGSLGSITVFRFLHRPLAPLIEELLAPGGLLVYETFTRAQRAYGAGPRNPDFLLAEGELPSLFPSLEILESWEGTRAGRRREAVASIVARRPR